ncbi:MAG TPA: Calx-beta domain-containing protein [Pyrinomonadaceae bacterium]|nr:Calx-beta domain-containing protein [Pyrinomonadaceae bacterium]
MHVSTSYHLVRPFDVVLRRRLLLAASLLCMTLVLCQSAAAQSTLTVTNTNDTGAGSFRQAILDSNALAGTQTIAFNIPGSGVRSIVPATVLPAFNDPVIIDGYTQPGASVNTLAEGSNAVLLVELVGPGGGGAGIQLRGGNSVVRGLVINRFNNAPAININNGDNNRVEGCFLGTDATGTVNFTDQSREGVGINNSTGNVIGGTMPAARNVISGHRLNGINIFGTGAGNNVVEGNLIGLDKTGTVALGNGQVGISISGFTHNRIGGTTAAARNIISANNAGLQIFTGANTIQGNYIGTDVTGMLDRGNNGSGVFMQGAANNLVGGVTSAPGLPPGNLISGNSDSGIDMNGNVAPGHTFQGNLIGTNAEGTAAIPNTGDGITLRNSGGGNLVGDQNVLGRNVISGNGQFGLTLGNSSNRVLNNYIGTGEDGTTALGNARSGVLINSQNGNALTGNLIAYNTQDGIAVNFFASGTGNPFRTNLIFANGSGGIDLGNNGLTANDAGDADTGANNLQNFPVLTAVSANGGTTGVLGSLNSTPNTAFEVEFYVNQTCDPSGHGEGQTYVGFTPITTDASGNAAINVQLFAAIQPGLFMTATATDAAGNTSEFSACRQVTNGGGGALSISGKVSNGASGVSGVQIALTGTQSAVTVTDANGDYAFGNLTPGDYSVAAQSPYFAFTQQRVDFPGLMTSQAANFTVVPGGNPTLAPAPTDNFDAAERDAAKWNLGTLTQPPGSYDPLVTVVQEGGRLVITPRSNVAGRHYNGYVSVNSFDFTGGQLGVEVVSAANAPAETIFAIGSDADNFYRFMVTTAGNPALSEQVKAGAAWAWGLNATSPVLVFQVKIDGVVSQQVIPYDPVQHRYWRFRHEPQTNSIVFETSPNGTTYTERHRVALQKGVASLACEMSAGTATAVSNPGQAIFDNLSLVSTTAQFAAANFTVNEGEGRATITITRSGNVTGASATLVYQTVDNPAAVRCDDLATLPGEAFARCDYATSIDAISFAAGESSKTFTVPIVDDSFAEGAETFRLKLTVAGGASLGAPALITVTINDNDAGQGGTNPINQTPFFVRQQYLDFLSREPEPEEPWSGVLNRCPNINTGPEAVTDCDRIAVSAAFFGSQEFRLKGFYVFTFYQVAFDGQLPEYTQIVQDMRNVTGTTAAETFQKRASFATDFAARSVFKAAFDAKSNADYVAALLARYQLMAITTRDPQNPESAQRVVLTKDEMTNRLGAGTLTRAQVLRAVVEADEVQAAEFTRAFVATQYYGYLRRTPDEGGYQGWLKYLKENPNDSRTMVHGFLNSVEYKLRFGRP